MSTFRSCLILFSLDVVELPCKWRRVTRHLLRRVGLFIHPEHTRASPLTQVAWCRRSPSPVHLPTENHAQHWQYHTSIHNSSTKRFVINDTWHFPSKKRMKGGMYEYKSIHLHIHSRLSVANPSPSSTSSGSRSNPWLLESKGHRSWSFKS